MPAFPNKNDLIGIGYSKSVFRSALSTLCDFITGLLGTAGTTAGAQVALQVLLGAGVAAKTGAYTIIASDRGKVLKCTGTFTITHLTPSTAGNGFAFAVVNEGSGAITVGSVVINAGGSSFFVCDGSSWSAVGGMPGILPIASGGTGATSASSARAALGVVSIDQNYGELGSYCMCKSTVHLNPGATAAGSSLYPGCVDIAGNIQVDSTSLSGTWRLCGKSLASTTSGPRLTLWQRIA